MMWRDERFNSFGCAGKRRWRGYERDNTKGKVHVGGEADER